MGHTVDCFVFVTQVCQGVYPQRVTRVMHLQHKRPDTILIIIIILWAQRTFSSLKHYHSLWLHILDVFSLEDAFLVKSKAAVDLELMTKLLVVVHVAAENKSAVSHFHYAMKTEDIEIHTD